MKPLSIKLEGFTGILSGSGKESLFLDLNIVPNDARLVAFVGPNGAGKSTIMDNLHPYRVMPSRSTTLGPGGFSYWDNICASTAMKDLIWEHGGKRYRSTLTFKVSGKTKKADCYAFEWNGDLGDWTPIKLNDGTLSDGKSETYDRCVESILGLPERFFTSQFSAQNRKSLSSYGASDVKALLADILDLNHYRELSAKASLVGKLLRGQLDGLQDEISQSRAADQGVAEVQIEISNLELETRTCGENENIALVALDNSRNALAMLEAKRNSQAKDVEERKFLNDQISRAKQNVTDLKQKVKDQSAVDLTRLLDDDRKAKTSVNDAQRELVKVDAEIERLKAVLIKKEVIEKAAIDVPRLREKIGSLDVQIENEQAKLAVLIPARTLLQEYQRKQTELVTAGNAKNEAIVLLEKTGSLVTQVPCHGLDIQKKCPLLEQANQAMANIEPQKIALVDMRNNYKAISEKVVELDIKVGQCKQLENEIKQLSIQRQEAMKALDELNQMAAMSVVLNDAEIRLPQLEESKKQQQAILISSNQNIVSCAEKIQSIKSGEKVSLEKIDADCDVIIKTYTERLELLQTPVSESEIDGAKQRVHATASAVEVVRTKLRYLSNQKISLLAKLEAFNSIKKKVEVSIATAERLKDEIAKWKLIEKGMGNDGLVALSIDDAGPEISGLCNSLLSECYDGRFAVRLDTQRTTQAGNLKETFDVMVFDNHRGEEKLLSSMSGGERVWVNECLTRAIALYVGETNSVQYQTLFTDEADGALDPDRKRQFMQMKRAVLDRGGYEREYFITQTPELWELADHIIDVTTL
jgi:exonuclease SbcC